MTARLLIGDVRERLAGLPDRSVDLVVTSPPFLALRSYLPPDHPDKHREIGGEPTPAAFLATLYELAGEFRRVLAPHGSIAIELGDTYSGSGGSGGDYNEAGMREGQERFVGSARNGRRNPGWPMAKSLCLIPHLFAAGLAYGRHPLTGEASPAGQWRVRNMVAWVRPNPPVGALGDKYRPATSYVTIATLAGNRWFDDQALRTPATGHPRTAKGVDARVNDGKHADDDRTGGNRSTLAIQRQSVTAPPLDWWSIPPQPYKTRTVNSHYAVYPPELPRRLITSMCPERVCTVCGEPSRRLVSREQVSTGPKNVDREHETGTSCRTRTVSACKTTGWTDCGHDDAWRPGVVLDPFAGSGTTLHVAHGLGRDSIGIDLDARNVALVEDRFGPLQAAMHLEVACPGDRP